MADPGDTLHFSTELYDRPPEDGGVLSNAAGVTLTVTEPDGTATQPTIINPPVEDGLYFCDYPTDALGPFGRYEGRWVFTMLGGQTESYVESFDVSPSLVSVDEALAHLRAAGVVTTAPDLEYLQWLCLVATEAVERDLHRTFVRRTVTETYDGGGPEIFLHSTPVLSVTSVTENGSPIVDYILRSGGVLQRGTSTSARYWARGWGNVTVAYVAGYTDPPRAARDGALSLIQSMWQTSQQAPHPGLNEFGEEPLFLTAPALQGPQKAAYDSLRDLRTFA